MYKITAEFDEPPVERTVGDGATSGRVYVPKAWIGCNVMIALIPQHEDNNK